MCELTEVQFFVGKFKEVLIKLDELKGTVSKLNTVPPAVHLVALQKFTRDSGAILRAIDAEWKKESVKELMNLKD